MLQSQNGRNTSGGPSVGAGLPDSRPNIARNGAIVGGTSVGWRGTLSAPWHRFWSDSDTGAAKIGLGAPD